MEIRKFGAQAQTQRENIPLETPVSNGPITPNSLPEEIINMFNERLGDEYAAHYFYRNAANWCKNINYKKTYKWL